MSKTPKTKTPKQPVPATVSLKIGKTKVKVPFETAFAMGCDLVEKGDLANAAKLFEGLEDFADRGPRAFIMHAYCAAALGKFDECSAALNTGIPEENAEVAAALHDAFVSYHAGLRKDGIQTIMQLANENPQYPRACLLLGNMLAAQNRWPLAGRCWSMAMQRDRPGGAVALAAQQRLAKHAEHVNPHA
jgi:thioredoxin-like negative regulator of GroEL